MPRYKCVVEYNGAPFAGWQRQRGLETVQGALERALAVLTPSHGPVHAAGRTDAGVHAEGQVFHVDAETSMTCHAFRQAINALTRPLPVSVVRAEIVDSHFHARFSALRRAYRYRILNRRAPSVTNFTGAWHVPVPLDVEAMRAAAALLTGAHDFTSFRDSECQASSACKTLDRLDILSRPAPGGEGHILEIEAEARSFLHHMVRNVTGTLAFVGQGKIAAEHMPAILAAKRRSAAGPCAPAHGLTFTHVTYP